jgi:hypothetical protein
MPNYLQRIAVSAVRTTSPAKPAVSAPTIMPHAAAPGWPPAPDRSEPAEALPDLESLPMRISPPDEVVSNRQSAAQPPQVASLDDAPSPIASAAEPQSRRQINLGASTVHGPLIHAPKGLRGAAQDRGQQRAIVSAMEHTLHAITPGPMGVAKPPVHGEVPFRRLATEATIQGLSRTTDPLHGESGSNEEDVVEPPQKAEHAVLPETVTHRESPPAQSESTLVTDKQDQDARSVGIRAVPARQAVTMAVPGPAAAGRHSKISIGRIDVQVNNTPAAADSSPAPAVPMVHSNFLEARYLNRFFLKP